MGETETLALQMVTVATVGSGQSQEVYFGFPHGFKAPKPGQLTPAFAGILAGSWIGREDADIAGDGLAC